MIKIEGSRKTKKTYGKAIEMENYKRKLRIKGEEGRAIKRDTYLGRRRECRKLPIQAAGSRPKYFALPTVRTAPTPAPTSFSLSLSLSFSHSLAPSFPFATVIRD
jgi:hypothetical protein